MDVPRNGYAPGGGSCRELRIAIVCYGGVSLAIYMHGMTREIHNLVRASVAYDSGSRTENPFDGMDSAGAYWRALRRLQDRRSGAEAPRTRVVVDIVSGTSAGGINGIYLSKALAENRSQAGLKRVWIDKGDIRRLLGARTRLGAGARSLWRVVRGRPPLDGAFMTRELHGALRSMDTDPVPDGPHVDSLLPPGSHLDLFVPVTDFYGWARRLPVDNPQMLVDRVHRRVLRFSSTARRSDATTTPPGFDAVWNHALAFAARATSSFPGAFPPVSVAAYGRAVPDSNLGVAARALFPTLDGDTAVSGSWFVDGGVLDNAPFASSIEAIKDKPAGTQVDRRLVYVEPDPAEPPLPSQAEAMPTLLSTVWQSLSAIPSDEPIADELDHLARRNAFVLRVRDIIESSFEDVRDSVRNSVRASLREGGVDLPVEMDPGTLPGLHRRLRIAARDEVGRTYGMYERARILDVLDEGAAIVRGVQRIPAGSAVAEYVGRVVRAHAVALRVLRDPDSRPPAREEGAAFAEAAASEMQRVDGVALRDELLERADLAYEERRIRFVINALNWWYRDVGRRGYPARGQLDGAKARLYDLLGELARLRDQSLEGWARAGIDAAFHMDDLRAAVEDSLPPEDYVRTHEVALIDNVENLRSALSQGLDEVRRDLDGVVADLCDDLATGAGPGEEGVSQVAGKVCSDLQVRYLGFPFWDTLVHPVQSIAGVDERDNVEVVRFSPRESTLLTGDPGQDGDVRGGAEAGEFVERRLAGVGIKHFGAFFDRAGREGDYLWGRLDGAERLLALLYDDPGRRGTESRPEDLCAGAFRSILREEFDGDDPLTGIDDLGEQLEAAVRRLERDSGANGATVSSLSERRGDT